MSPNMCHSGDDSYFETQIWVPKYESKINESCTTAAPDKSKSFCTLFRWTHITIPANLDSNLSPKNESPLLMLSVLMSFLVAKRIYIYMHCTHASMHLKSHHSTRGTSSGDLLRTSDGDWEQYILNGSLLIMLNQL